MKLASITLQGYRGFRLTQTTHFKYEPRNKTQVILGTNGSGKSSLIQQLSPLPADPNDFKSGGFKEVVYPNHRGKNYRLINEFSSSGNRYHFIEDGVELNPGFTLTVYRDLVRKKFGITPETKDVLTGVRKFTDMSINERRNWFTLINPTDYSYAIAYHKRLKDQIKTVSGALDRTKDHLVQESAKTLSEDDERVLSEQTAKTRRILEELLQHKTKPADGQQGGVFEARLGEVDYQLQGVTFQTREAIDYLARNNIGLDDIDTQASERQIRSLESKIASLQGTMTQQSRVLDKLRRQHEALSAKDGVDLEALTQTLQDLSEAIDDLHPRLRHPVAFESPQEALRAYKSILEDMTRCVSRLKEVKHLNKEDRASLAERISLATERLKQHRDQLYTLNTEKVHLEKHRDADLVECPKCTHSWHPGYDERLYNKVLSQIQATEEAERKANTYLQTLLEDQQAASEFTSLYGTIVGLRNATPSLQSFWSAYEISPEHYDRFLAAFGTLASDLQIHIRLQEHEARIKELNAMKAAKESTAAVDMERLTKELDEEEKAFAETSLRERTLRSELTLATEKHHHLTIAKRAHQDLIESYQRYTTVYEQGIRVQYGRLLDEMIFALRSSLSIDERRLANASSQRAVVSSLSNQVQELTKELELLKLTQKVLCPAEGLIAQGLTGFINDFIEQMNTWIGSVWTYPMELMPIEIMDDAVDLDYKFPVVVNHDYDDPSLDVAKTSTGMKEIINLAFVIVSMNCLGLEDMPLFLDEFSTSFDLTHRQAAYKVIESLIDNSNYSQIFMVSHYRDGYANLQDTDFVVLCPANIDLPENCLYNEHVQMS